MPINYNIQADVVDIQQDTPQPTDRFFIDTNVWFWMTYSNASQSAKQYQIDHYPDYLNKALGVASDILRSALSLAELTHLIEKTEYEIFRVSNAFLRLKEYRHNKSAERTRVVSEVKASWAQVEMLSESFELKIDSAICQKALQRFSEQKVDGYDLFLLEAMQQSGITQIITDDGDFATVPGIEVFTANSNPSLPQKCQKWRKLDYFCGFNHQKPLL